MNEIAYKGVRVSVQLMTPELARELLDRNDRNRSLSKPNLLKLKREVAAGRWKFNGDPIRISKTGQVIDGQHRLQLCAQTGQSFPVVMVEGLDDDVFDTIDTGKSRTASDVLSVMGSVNCHRLSAALGVVDRYFSGSLGNQHGGGLQPSEVAGVLARYPEATASVQYVGSGESIIGAGLLGGLHCLFKYVDEPEANRFVDDLKTGVGLTSDDPVYLLRERLVKDRASKSRLPRHEIAALAIKAWNARRSKGAVRLLRWRNDEVFPVISGH